MNQPRRYRMSNATRPKAIFGSMDHELRIAWDIGDIGSAVGYLSYGLRGWYDTHE